LPIAPGYLQAEVLRGLFVQTILLYGEDGTEYRAYVHQKWINATSMDGETSIPGFTGVKNYQA
jgi:hypothetical protein